MGSPLNSGGQGWYLNGRSFPAVEVQDEFSPYKPSCVFFKSRQSIITCCQLRIRFLFARILELLLLIVASVVIVLTGSGAVAVLL